MDCPLLELRIYQCDAYLNVTHLEDAFDKCVDHYSTCPIYLQVMGQADEMSKAIQGQASLSAV